MSNKKSLDEFSRLLTKLVESKLSEVDFGIYAEKIRFERQKGFMQSKSPTGEKWLGLLPATIARKSGKHKTTKIRKGVLYKSNVQKSRYPDKPLIDKEYLMNPTIKVGKNYGKVILAKSRSANIWNSESVSTIHQKGLKPQRAKREHWGIYPEAIEFITEDFNRKVVSEIRRFLGVENG
jgi:hypothetical protein